jgi:cytochrome c-type biogenesis protein CcmH
MAAHCGGRLVGLMFAAVLACTAGVASVTAADDDAARVPGARELEGKLIAPCCWTQTLDIHDSPIAEQLRAEISQRLKRGEQAATIEDDLAARYGEKIRAVPRGEDPRQALPVLVGGAMGIAAIWLVWLGISWLRRNKAAPPSQSPEAQQWDKQLDDELEQMSDVS